MKEKGKIEQQTPIEKLAWNFLLSRRISTVEGTQLFYAFNVGLLLKYATGRGIAEIEQLTPAAIDAYFGELATTHNPGGVHCAYRVLKTFLLWYERTFEPPNFRNPIRRITPPRRPRLILDPISLDVVRALISTCPHNRFEGVRDKAIFRALVDTGARAGEFLAMDFGDLDFGGGTIVIPRGKGMKRRVVFIGIKTRKAIRSYLRWRPAALPDEPLWATSTGSRLTYSGLRDMIEDRAARAGVERPPVHAFRRTFAVEALRGGMNPYAMQEILGHEDQQITRLYVKLVFDDLLSEHIKASPGDRL